MAGSLPKPSGTNYRESAQYQNAMSMADDMQREDKMRNELFAGKLENGTGQPQEELTVDQLVKKAEDQHAETTQSAQRALKVLEQTKQVQADTMAELDSQRKQVHRLNDKLNKVNEELTYSEKLLLYMRRCCCCWIFDSCTGADPEGQRKREWERRVERGETRSAVENAGRDRDSGKDTRRSTKSAGGTSAGGASSGGNGFRNPDIKLTDEHKATEARMHAETRKQNEILDQIHAGLGNLLDNAKAIHHELDDANKDAEKLHDKVEATKGRIENVNTKSQLRKFR